MARSPDERTAAMYKCLARPLLSCLLLLEGTVIILARMSNVQ